jgi:predicted nucleotidyltransferase
MGRKTVTVNDRARQMLAQEAARIIVEQGIQDFRLAKVKAAERLGLSGRGSLPGNSEIQQAVGEHLTLFGRESHSNLLQALRRAALSAMEILSPFSPRLVGPVLHGTAATNSAVNLHVFSDTPELIAMKLDENRLAYRSYERRLKSRRDRAETFAGYRFLQDDSSVEATVFPVNGMRQAPISPVDGRPMKRADHVAVQKLLDDT